MRDVWAILPDWAESGINNRMMAGNIPAPSPSRSFNERAPSASGLDGHDTISWVTGGGEGLSPRDSPIRDPVRAKEADDRRPAPVPGVRRDHPPVRRALGDDGA